MDTARELSSAESRLAFRLLGACSQVLFRVGFALLAYQQQQLQPTAEDHAQLSLPRLPTQVVQNGMALHGMWACHGLMHAAVELIARLTGAACDGESLARAAVATMGTACKPTAVHSFWTTCVALVAHCHDRLGKSLPTMQLSSVFSFIYRDLGKLSVWG